MKCNAIILAGGKSSRMGSDKGLVMLGEKPMIQHIIDNLNQTEVNEIIIISNNEAYKQFACAVYPDIIKEKGPLCGIYTGLMKSSTTRNIVLSCDVPLISPTVINFLIRNNTEAQINIVQNDTLIHCLVGIWESSVRKQLRESIISEHLKVADFLNENQANYIDLKKSGIIADETVLSNINTKQDLNRIANGM